MKPNLRIVKPSTPAEKQTSSTTETIEISPNEIKSWRLPPFQRPLTVNDRVEALAKQIAADDGVIPGVLTVGLLDGDRYLIDGQHRRHAFLMSNCIVGYCDVRILHVTDMAAMAEEFDHLNSRLVNMRPDDYLRAMEPSYPELARIRRECPYVGYGQIRRNEKAPIVSMSALLRCWMASSKESPASGHFGGAAGIARNLSADDAHGAIEFMKVAYQAWGRDVSATRLWGSLTLTLTMWMWRRVVRGEGASANSRAVKLTREMFTKCMMSVAADAAYNDWLVGRQLGERDRSPAYTKLKNLFAARVTLETGGKVMFPQPAWQASH